MSPNDADGMANSVDPDQSAPLGGKKTGFLPLRGSLKHDMHLFLSSWFDNTADFVGIFAVFSPDFGI